MVTIDLSLREARRIMLGSQLLAGKPPARPTQRRMRETISHLGALQIDTIHVVARSHHIVLWSRLGEHPQGWLDNLLGKERAIFEYWSHAAAFTPIELFPYFRRQMLRHADLDELTWSERSREWLTENRAAIDEVMQRITEHGPVSSTSFDAPEGSTRAEAWAWYGNKPTNRALEMLWTMGEIMVDRREKFQRWYDLTKRIHPAWSDDELPTIEDERLALARVAIRAMGVTTTRWLPDYFRMPWGSREGIATALLHELQAQGDVTPVRIRGIDEPAWVSTEALTRRYPLSRTTLLSPFDSLIWDRRRTQQMFDFELRLESYPPAPRRQYGYFCLPILYRDQLVGRLDPKADRRDGLLRVQALHLEPWFEPKADDRFYASLAATLGDFARFNGCEHVAVERSNPADAALRLTGSLGDCGLRRPQLETPLVL